LTKTGLGRLQLWHQGRYKPYQGVAFEDRTPGDLFEEFYLEIAGEIEQLAGRRMDLSGEELERLMNLEESLEPAASDRTALKGLSEEDSLEVYGTAHKSGDPLADYWEYRLSKGLDVDLDMRPQDIPPRDEWDKAD
jgi:hypothetical protein